MMIARYRMELRVKTFPVEARVDQNRSALRRLEFDGYWRLEVTSTWKWSRMLAWAVAVNLHPFTQWSPVYPTLSPA